jgi:Aspartyl protease
MQRRGLLRAFAILSFTALASASAAADDGTAVLLAKHRAFVGWQLGDGAFKTLHLTREYVNENGKVTERATESRTGIIYRNTYTYLDRANTVEDTGFTGNIFWSTNENGFTTPVYGELAKYRLSLALLLNEGTAELKGTALGSVRVAGKQLQRIRLDVPHADPIDVDVDPNTGAYVRAVIDPDGENETTLQILSYTQIVPGKKAIGSFRFGDGNGGTYFYRTIEPNKPISDEQLHPPAQRAAWAYGKSSPVPVTVTARRILVDATINGVKGRFILDTGASSIVLNEAFADRARVQKLNAGGRALTLYGTAPSDMRKIDSIAIGDSVLSNVIAHAEDFTAVDYRGLDRQNYDGLLGYDIFAGAVVTLNFQSQTMTIGEPGSLRADPSGVGVLTDTSLWVPMIPMTLNRSIAVNAMLDTGNPAAVVFGPDLLYKYHLRMARNIGFRPGMGSIECGNLDSLQIGPITYGGEMACKLDSELVSGRKILVGLDFLRHFTVVFDYPRGRLFLQPQRE